MKAASRKPIGETVKAVSSASGNLLKGDYTSVTCDIQPGGTTRRDKTCSASLQEATLGTMFYPASLNVY
jgi:hypothetical protein